jgi:Fe-S cluster assembly iron-binding protein IscA
MRPGLRLALLAAACLSASACNRRAAPSATAPSAPVVTFTPEAVQQVFRYRDHHKVAGRWRLRVEVHVRPGGLGKHLVDLDLDPTSPDDFEYDFEGIRVVVARSQVDKLRGSTVGYRALPDKEGFFVTNPNLPDTQD